MEPDNIEEIRPKGTEEVGAEKSTEMGKTS